MSLLFVVELADQSGAYGRYVAVRSLAKRPEDWLEQELDGHLFRSAKSLAAQTGWLTYHTLRSRGSKAGFPDRTCVRERVLFVELKVEKGKPTELQVEWLDRLVKAGGEVYLWRPSDLGEIGLILGHRWYYDFALQELDPVHPGPRLAPRSLWRGSWAGGRRDAV